MEWLADLPEHWKRKRLKFLSSRPIRNGLGKAARSAIPAHPRYIRTTDIAGPRTLHSHTFRSLSPEVAQDARVYKNDILISAAGSVGKSYYADGLVGEACFAGYLVRVSPVPSVDSSFLSYWTESRDYWSQIEADVIQTTIQNFSATKVRNLLVPIPPLNEQAAIARFLGVARRRVRQHIRTKEKLIGLLEEYRRVLISDAVTGRIDLRTGCPYPAYKDSSVGWLGKVPEHWEVRRLKTFSCMQSGDSITAMSIEETGEYPVYGGNGLRGYTSDYTHDGEFVLIGRQGALCGNIHLTHGRVWASEHAVVTTLHDDFVLGWFGALLEVMNLNQYSIASAQPGLSVDRILNLWAPVPPALEQTAIARSLGDADRRISMRRKTLERQISLLREYRTRLIADVVTGKLDVREAAAAIPDADPLAGEVARSAPEPSTEI